MDFSAPSFAKKYFLLYVDTVEWDWQQYPIMHLDLNVKKYETKEDLYKVLNRHIELWEQTYDSPYGDRDVEERFLQVVRLAYEKTGRQVVILVDEYDKPLLQAIDNESLQSEYRSILKPFYGVLKSCDRYIKFAFLTGVTKFGKVSVFSDLNNLFDLSLDHRYTGICGISEQELHDYFDTDVAALAEAEDGHGLVVVAHDDVAAVVAHIEHLEAAHLSRLLDGRCRFPQVVTRHELLCQFQLWLLAQFVGPDTRHAEGHQNQY